MGNKHNRVYIENESRKSNNSCKNDQKPKDSSSLNYTKDQNFERHELINKALNLYNERRLEDALSLYNQLKKLFPYDPIPWILEGDVVTEIGSIKNSINLYGKATQLDPLCSDAWYRMAQCYVLLKNYQQAAWCFENAILSFGTSKSVYSYVMSLSQVSRYDEALYILDRYAELKVPDVYYHSYRSSILIELGRLNDAENELKKAFKFQNIPIITYTSSTVLFLLKKEYETALKCINSAIKKSESNGYIYGYRALAYIGLGDLENAMVDIIISLDKSPKNHIGLLAKAKLLFIENNIEDSLQIAEFISEEKHFTSNKYIQSETTKLINELNRKAENKKEKVRQLFNETKITNTLKNISLRYSLNIEPFDNDNLSSNDKNNYIKSNVKALLVMLKSKMSEIESDLQNLNSLKEETMKLG